MQEVRLTLKKRAFPSQGRVRFNIAHLPEIGILEGDHVDLINEATSKTISVSVMADTMVREGQVRVSEEDLKTLGLSDDDEIVIRKALPVREKTRRVAADAGKPPEGSTKKPAGGIKKIPGGVKAGAVKTTAPVKKEIKKASDKSGKASVKTAVAVKKMVKKAKGSRKDH